ncbi:MAG: YafY family transcriptional regulator [Chloroflexaceae bacterium]|jgi:predicted DNA-binding transcriptional regulator YafY|nr:YafY family transcriptional regulator [Chloroflexaceae bacterium]
MYHPTTRLLTVLELLQSHGSLSGAELARRLEVSTRTIRHYLTLLQDLGIPVEATRGPHGGYRLRPGYKLPPLLFTPDEAVALTLGLLTARQAGLTIASPAVEGALAKVERVLPAAVQSQVRVIQETLVIDVSTPYIPPASDTLLVLSEAAQRRVRVRVRYHDWQGKASEREIEPYGLVYHGGRWFAVGHCCMRAAQRVFRLDRIERAELAEGSFSRPAGVDLLGAVLHGLATTPGRWQIEVLLHTSLIEARRHIAPNMATLEETTQGVLLRCAVQHLAWFAHMLAGLPFSLVVRQPPELRAAMHELAAETLRRAATEEEGKVDETTPTTRPSETIEPVSAGD